MVVFEPFVYLVSLILKAWHLLFAGAIGMPASTSWIVSIVFAVVTVRSAILYFTVQQLVSGRKGANLRPHLRQLSDRYKTSGDPDAPKFVQWGSAELREQAGIRTATMLAPLFIQIPVIIGLVRLFREMLKAAAAPGQPATHGVAFLTREEVSDFLSTKIFDIPLPAYIAMKPAQYQQLGITQEHVVNVCLPALFAAATFTGLNIILSTIRARKTLDYSNKFARSVFRFTVSMIFFSPFLILFFGVVGPSAVALILYWVCSNLWTFGQNIVLTIYLEKKYPLSNEFKALQASQKEDLKKDKQAAREIKKFRRQILVQALMRPWLWSKYRAHYKKSVAEYQAHLEKQKGNDPALTQKVAQYRYVIGQMRTTNQDNLPSLKPAVRINDSVPMQITIPERQKHWLEKLPRKLLITVLIFRGIGLWVYGKFQKLLGKEPSQWKRFRE